jgi:hypothetical protein
MADLSSAARAGIMDHDEAIKLLKGGQEGIGEWNQRRISGEVIPNLTKANLTKAKLSGADLSGAVLTNAKLFGADLIKADLIKADLIKADLIKADLSGATLREANLSGADLSGADLRWANLSGANLKGANLKVANLKVANLSRANLLDANLGGAMCWFTNFADVDLSEIQGLDSIDHRGPSTIGVGTLFRSKGKIPKVFLRGCGVPDSMIEYLPSLIGSMSPIQFYSCIIRYSHKDEEFAKRLHSKLRDQGLRVWYAPEDIQGGQKLPEQIDEAIRIHDKLLLVLSRESMGSEWVKTEIRKARKAELSEKRRKLFPIRLVNFEAIQKWECFDADSGKDLGVEIRESFIPDFSNWKDHDSFEAAFVRLLDDLKAGESAESSAPASRPTRRKKPR